MVILAGLQPCKYLCVPNSSFESQDFLVSSNSVRNSAFLAVPRLPVQRISNSNLCSTSTCSDNCNKSKKLTFRRRSSVLFCSRNDIFDNLSSTQLPDKPRVDGIQEIDEIGLLNKPSPAPISNGVSSEIDQEVENPDENEALAPFMKFFKNKDSADEKEEEERALRAFEETIDGDDETEIANKLNVEYYEPKPGDVVVGVVVSGNENKLDINVGADLLGTMLTKEVLPLYDKEMESLTCDLDKDAESFMMNGKMGLVKYEDAFSRGQGPGRPVVENGTVLFAEVLGRTLSGRPLLSTRRLFRRLAWHRVRQIKGLDEPIEVKISEWNTGGLLTRIEGLRAFLPKAELLNRVNNFTELKENVGRRIFVQITRMDEAKNDLILSEKQAWETLYLREGTLLEGTVKKIFPYGAQIRIGDTNRSGLLHVSNITRARVTSVSDLLSVGEKVNVLVVKSMFPDKISLSIADLESEPGLFITNKEKVFSEAKIMAKKYRQRLPSLDGILRPKTAPTTDLPFENESSMYANWKWFKFER
ncbi:protein PIGMENT DEFECTIVE 338, chloroplastic isoform X1 [Cucumis sativus]|uniref:S1 motif domain-containing protein n=1 Tax=Cucumis sativus TaxID=3659 RepID=A0A0A0K9H0_CUCSA|nr:protein PIGMENT DEFECTIVE 338, chloroplastic isoform X1 [Cucumis sativus]